MRGTENDELANYVFYYDTICRVLEHALATRVSYNVPHGLHTNASGRTHGLPDGNVRPVRVNDFETLRDGV
ncbi:MAG: hypothetical protein JW395_2243 [Nitrospira sp.]|nr:hypothetical protein [Nitrospira sp.]